MLVKVQPSAGKAIHGIANMQQQSTFNKYASFIPPQDDANINTLRIMVDIALEDGQLTDDEVAMLTRKAEDSGLDADLFKIGLLTELAKLTSKN